MLYILRSLIRKLPGVVIKAVPLPDPDTVSGYGSRDRVGELCRKNEFKRVLLVTDRTIFSLGLHEKITDSLAQAGIFYTVFSDIAGEPDLTIVDGGRNALADCKADAIIALGGGAVMDSCKMIAAGGRLIKRKSGTLLQKFLFVRKKTFPIIAVPTTAGTGAEITVGAVVTNAKGNKVATVVVGLDVRAVILDSELTIKAPKGITCACGIDALSHGLEGVAASVRVSDDDMKKSMECVRLVLKNLPVLINEPANADARQNMCLAAHYGGNAINKQLAGYVHAFAHSIGAKYHIPHGNAIAISLLPVMDMQKGKCMKHLADLSRYCALADDSVSDADACDKLLDAIRELIAMCGFDDRKDFIAASDYRSLAHAIAWDSINYAPPIVMSNRQIYALLDEIDRKQIAKEG
ncbi:MAG: iron-containing alcohol dehydrogenase [Clostridia bacterium]|nr:iron-containing alcohol dehydrogenase [Clostridia bacterium]